MEVKIKVEVYFGLESDRTRAPHMKQGQRKGRGEEEVKKAKRGRERLRQSWQRRETN